MESLYLSATDTVFDDRRAAGRALAQALVERGTRCQAVLGLVRGGVPVALEVAQALQVPLDILAVKKLRAPLQEELAIGAICADGTQVLHQDIIRELQVSPGYLEREIQERLREAREAEETYRHGLPPLDLAGSEVIVVDDGIATGATMEAGVLSARHQGAKSILVATPVGSRQACASLERIADKVFCLMTPVDFWAVGQFYRHFSQVEDQEVRELLAENRRARLPGGKRS